jgi:hypothetical protein
MSSYLSDLPTAEWLTGLATFLLVLVTGIAFFIQSRQNRFALSIDLLLKLEDRFDEQRMQASRGKASTFLRGQQGLDDPSPDWEHHLDAVLDFFDLVGHLLRKGALQKTAVWSVFFYSVHGWYCNAKDHITLERERDSTVWEDLVYLHSELVITQKRQLGCEDHHPSLALKKGDLIAFLEEENAN